MKIEDCNPGTRIAVYQGLSRYIKTIKSTALDTVSTTDNELYNVLQCRKLVKKNPVRWSGEWNKEWTCSGSARDVFVIDEGQTPGTGRAVLEKRQ